MRLQNIGYIIFIALCSLIQSACTPKAYLVKPKDFKHYVNGMIFNVAIEHGANRKGEIIAVDSNEIILLDLHSHTTVKIIKAHITRGDILISRASNLSDIGPIPLLTLGHGWFSVLTFPINLGVITPIATDHYLIKYPNQISWSQLNKFARFPQGLPANIALYHIK